MKNSKIKSYKRPRIEQTEVYHLQMKMYLQNITNNQKYDFLISILILTYILKHHKNWIKRTIEQVSYRYKKT